MPGEDGKPITKNRSRRGLYLIEWFARGGLQTYIFKVLKEVHPNLGISRKGMDVMEVRPVSLHKSEG